MDTSCMNNYNTTHPTKKKKEHVGRCWKMPLGPNFFGSSLTLSAFWPKPSEAAKLFRSSKGDLRFQRS